MIQRLYSLWDEWSEAYFANNMTPPYLLLALPLSHICSVITAQ